MRDLARILTLTSLLGLLLLPAVARTRKGDGWMKQGREAELRKEYEKALELYEKALNDDPGDAGYQIASKRVRFQAGQTRVDLGQKLRNEGRLEDALAEFQKAYAIDPASGIADQEIRKTKEMIEREKKKPSPTTEERGLTPGDAAEKEAQERVARMLPIPEIKPLNRKITTLKMNNQPVRVLYETVGKLAGLNVVMDPEFQPAGGKTNFTVDLSNTTTDEALDHLSIITKTFWKPLSTNTIFVTADNVTKRRDYEDYVVKVFYIKNATTVQELQEIATTVRSIAEIRRAFTYNALNAIMVRDTADKVALAEKLISDLDKPKSEVVVDVVVMQANRTRIRDLAATITTGGSPGINLPITYTGPYSKGATTTPAAGTTAGAVTAAAGGLGSGLIPITQIKNIALMGDFSTTVPGALLQAVMSDSKTRVLQQPQLRAVENQKASLRIGDKVPYASGSFTPAVGGVGQGFTPYAQTQFQFADVGVNVDLTPKVHGREDISMHVEVEISNVSGQVEIAGVKQPIISQRKVMHDIRIREGEVSLLGGLMASEDIHNINGIPGLMQIPILRYLFGTDHTEKRDGELLIALIPHIVRAPEFSEVNLRGVSAGSDATVKLNYAPRGDMPTEPGPALTQPQNPPGAQTPPQAVPQSPSQGGPQATPDTAPQTAPQPAPEQPPPPGNPPPPPPAAQSAAPALSLSTSAQTVQGGSPFTVNLQLDNAVDFFSASPIRVKFDPKIVKLTAVRQGGLPGSDGQRVNFTENTLNDSGDAIITINRMPGSGGVTGSGSLVSLTFQPVAKGTAQISVSEITVRNTQLNSLEVKPPAATVNIQ